MKSSPVTYNLIAFIVLFGLNQLVAQNINQKDAIGLKLMLLDYTTLYDGQIGDFRNLDNGLEVSYSRSIIKNINLYVPLRLGVVNPYQSQVSVNTVSADLQIQYQFWKEDSRVIPYIGLGGSFVHENVNGGHLQIPVGAGVDIRLSDMLSLNIQSEYRHSFAGSRNNIQTGVGFKILLGKSVRDRDGDSIPDQMDACPDIPGDATAAGCPDRDGDGIPDYLDACPDIFGEATAQGCPDRDGDGVADFEDLCPDEFGDPSNAGCPLTTIVEIKTSVVDVTDPLLDSDGDGIPDIDDKCPNEPGPAWNRGCPEIKEADQRILEDAMKEVQFDINKATLRPQSFKILDQIVDLMKRYPEYYIVINGHTDNTGSAALNQKLSEQRARTCYDYLRDKGVSAQKMSYRGYGQTKPIYSNDTEVGRALNRRVEFRMIVQ